MTEATSLDEQVYLANLRRVAETAPEVARAILAEFEAQRQAVKLIASENYCSVAVQAAMGNLLTDKYAEGRAGKRFYAGCDNVDAIEGLANRLACDLFGASHAYVQPHSGADANLVAFWAALRTKVELPELERLQASSPLDVSESDWESIRGLLGRQRLLAMDLYAGGHLTHGYRFNVSAKMFEAFQYGVDSETGLLNYDDLERRAREISPLVLLVGYSAYPRLLDFERVREIADSVGAVLIVDMAHFAGLVAGKVLTGRNDPIPYGDIVTSTTHKTLRGPRGGMVLARPEFQDEVDRGCPLVLGGPLPHVMAAKAVAFSEALTPEFQTYAHRVVENARALAEAFLRRGWAVVTGGTDNHQVMLDVRPFGLTGRQAESALRACGLTLNRNTIPGDTHGPWYTSGLRLGTAAVTTLGMGADEMDLIAELATKVVGATKPMLTKKGTPGKADFELESRVRERVTEEVLELATSFPVYPSVRLETLKRSIA